MIDQVRDTLRRASKVVDGPRKRTEEAVRRMAENPNFDLLDAPQVAIGFMRKGFNALGLATRDEVERLHARIAELEAASRGPEHVVAERVPEPAAHPEPPAHPDPSVGPDPSKPEPEAAAAPGRAARAKAAPVKTRARPARPKPTAPPAGG